MVVLANFLTLAINIYIWIIIFQVIVHWLMAFDVINPRSPQARNLMQLLEKITGPVMRPIQKYVPPIGGIDLSPLVAIIAGQVLIMIIYQVLAV